MLRKGKARVVAEFGTVPENLVFLQADALALPFKDGALSTILCHGAFHVFSSLDAVLAECNRILRREGRLFATSLVTERLLGNLYLGLLARVGEVASPRAAKEVAHMAREILDREVRAETQGNFVYVSSVG